MSFPAIQGFTAPGYEGVREAFRRNFAEHGETGAAFAAFANGRPVVHLWGGHVDGPAPQPWDERTALLVFSGTKGLVAMCVALLLERGQLELDAPVCRYWPELAVHGKQQLTVAHVMSHTAGLPGIRRRPLADDELRDGGRMAALLADEAPAWAPGTTSCYHSLTYGWLAGELVHRADGRSVGRFFAEEIARPLGLDLWIGLPPSQERRVAPLHLAADWGHGGETDWERMRSHPIGRSVYDNPPGFWDRERFGWWNAPATRRAEIPGAGAIGTPRAIARAYACLACGGELEGTRLLSAETVARLRRPLASGTDPVTGRTLAYGIGFQLQTERADFGPKADAFGHGGMGGSIHGAWPADRVAFSYAPALLRDDEDPRSASLLEALAQAVDAGRDGD